MKMDMLSELNGAPLSPDGNLPCATEIGREFVRQYYTLLSEKPQDVHRFYSHESVFVHGEVEAVGQQRIVNAIDSIGFDECKVRIHTIKGAHTLGQGIVLQVCGEMQETNHSDPRRFIQTIVLCQQTPKKFFVQNDIFQFADTSFNTLQDEKPISHNEPKVQKLPTIPSPKLNGHGHGSSPAAEKTVKAKPDNHHTKREKAPKAEKKEEVSPAKQSSEAPHVASPTVTSPPAAPVAVETKKHHQHRQASQAAAPAPPAVPAVPVKEEPKTWAKLVGGGSHSAAPVSAPKQQSAALPRANHEKAEARHNGPREEKKKAEEKRDDHRDEKKEERGSKLYIGGIIRNKIPDINDESTVIAEIFSVFSALGEVEGVQVPRKCYDAPINTTRLGTAFAFVAMKNPAEAQKVFNACTKDDSKANALRVAIPAFGFDGEVSVSISEPKLSSGRPPFRRDGPIGGGGRGSFAPRGGRGGRGFHGNN